MHNRAATPNLFSTPAARRQNNNATDVSPTRKTSPIRKNRLHTPDGRYFVADGKLHRCTDPALSDTQRRSLIKQLMQGRLAVRKAETASETESATALVHAAKVELGERGPAWWSDGAPDFSGRDPIETTYAAWWRANDGHPKKQED